MALAITTACINCDMCKPECPNQAIFEGDKFYQIDTGLCTECVGYYEKPTCIEVCPIDCIIYDPMYVESKEDLLLKAQQLMMNKS